MLQSVVITSIASRGNDADSVRLPIVRGLLRVAGGFRSILLGISVRGALSARSGLQGNRIPERVGHHARRSSSLTRSTDRPLFSRADRRVLMRLDASKLD